MSEHLRRKIFLYFHPHSSFTATFQLTAVEKFTPECKFIIKGQHVHPDNYTHTLTELFQLQAHEFIRQHLCQAQQTNMTAS